MGERSSPQAGRRGRGLHAGASRTALEAAGGRRDSIKDAIIDDCALAGRLKAQGPVWLGLTLRAESLRPYAGFGEVARMVSRSAYAQLGYSPWLLAGTVLGMGLTYLAPATCWRCRCAACRRRSARPPGC